MTGPFNPSKLRTMNFFPLFHSDVPKADIRLGKRMEWASILLFVVILLLIGVLIGSAFTGTAQAAGYTSRPTSSAPRSAPAPRPAPAPRVAPAPRPRVVVVAPQRTARTPVPRTTTQPNQELTDAQKQALARSQAQRNRNRRIAQQRQAQQRAFARQRLVRQRAALPKRRLPAPYGRIRNSGRCTAYAYSMHDPYCDGYSVYNSGNGYYLATQPAKSHKSVWIILGIIALLAIIAGVVFVLLNRRKNV